MSISTELNGYGNLEEMRARHLNLLAEPHPLENELRSFLRDGVELGRKLIDPKNRAEAQGMLNFWASTISSAHTPGERVKSSELESTHAESAPTFGVSGFVTLKPYDEQEAASYLESSRKKLSKTTPEQYYDVKRLLPSLLQLDGTSNQAILPALPEEGEILSPGGAPSAGFLFLKDAGILIPSSGTDGKNAYTLANESLIEGWEELRKFHKKRKAFRELARGWDRGGRSDAALLGEGREIQEAQNYRDKTSFENDFLIGSERVNQLKGRTRLKQLTAGVTVLCAALACSIIFACLISAKNKELKDKSEELRIEKDKLQNQKDELEKQVAFSQKQTAQLMIQRQELLKKAETEKLLREREREIQDTKLIEDTAAQRQVQTIESLRQKVATLNELTQGTQANVNIKAIIQDIETSTSDLATTPKEVLSESHPGDWQTGKAAVFDPATNPLVKPTDTLAIVLRWSEADSLNPPVFRKNISRGPRPLMVQLDPEAYYISARWNYKITPRKWLLMNKVRVKNPANGKEVEAQPVDWGPGASTGLMHISPGIAKALGLKPNADASLFIPN